MDNFVILSGCSGGGKSTLLAELARRGHAVVPEPGRRIVAQELERGGNALPWLDGAAFARRAIAMARADLAEARTIAATRPGWIFFDRGLIDAAAALEHFTGEPALAQLAQAHRFHRRVFLAPPWPEIHVADRERRHSLADAIVEYERLGRIYPALGYEVIVLPKASVAARAEFVLNMLDSQMETAAQRFLRRS